MVSECFATVLLAFYWDPYSGETELMAVMRHTENRLIWGIPRNTLFKTELLAHMGDPPKHSVYFSKSRRGLPQAQHRPGHDGVDDPPTLVHLPEVHELGEVPLQLGVEFLQIDGRFFAQVRVALLLEEEHHAPVVPELVLELQALLLGRQLHPPRCVSARQKVQHHTYITHKKLLLGQHLRPGATPHTSHKTHR